MALVRLRRGQNNQPKPSIRPLFNRRWALVNAHQNINFGSANAVGTLQGVAKYGVGRLGTALDIPSANIGALSYGANTALQLSTLSGICVVERLSSGLTPMFSTCYSNQTAGPFGFMIQINTSGKVEIDKFDVALVVETSNTIPIGGIGVVAWSYNSGTGRARIALDGVLSSATSVQSLAHGVVARGGYYSNNTTATNQQKQYLIAISPDEQTDAQLIYDSLHPWEIFEPSNTLFFIPSAIGATGLSGLAQSSASASGAITQSLALTGGSIAIATASGVLNQSVGLAGSAASISIANGVATITTTLSGAGLVSAFASGSISQAMALSGAAQSSAAATGALTGGADLAGAAQAAVTAAGQINMTLAISGASVTAALAAADISVDSPGLSGASTAAAVGSGALASTQPLFGNAAAAATATGDLTVIPPGFSGNAAGAAIAAGALFATVPISGAAPISVIGSGGLSSTLAVTGTAVAVATGSGDLTVGVGGLTGHALADALAGGSIALSLSLSAAALMQAVANAQLSVAYPYILPHGEYSIKRLTPRYSLKRAA